MQTLTNETNEEISMLLNLHLGQIMTAHTKDKSIVLVVSGIGEKLRKIFSHLKIAEDPPFVAGLMQPAALLACVQPTDELREWMSSPPTLSEVKVLYAMSDDRLIWKTYPRHIFVKSPGGPS